MSKNEFFFSIIMPVYNCETYIERAIESVCNQDYSNWELLIINDGSTDNSREKCNKFIRDKRIQIIDKDNSGVSDSRNIGIFRSRGRFILFLDADDWLENNCLSNINMYLANHKTDFLVFNYYECSQSSRNMARQINCSYSNLKDIIRFDLQQSQWKQRTWFGNLHTVWGKCFNADIIRNYKICFDRNLSIGEDMYFNLLYILHCNVLNYANYYLYNHFDNSDSVMHTLRWNGLSQSNYYFDVVERISNQYVDESILFNFWLETAEIDWKKIVFSNNSLSWKKTIFQRIFNDEKYQRFAKKGLNVKFKNRFYAFAIRNKLSLLLIVFTYLRYTKQSFLQRGR